MTQKTRRSKYPWPEWTDGGWHTITQGDDYLLTTYHMQISLHGRARSEEKVVTTRTFTERGRDDDGYVTEREGIRFQFKTKENHGVEQ